MYLYQTLKGCSSQNAGRIRGPSLLSTHLRTVPSLKWIWSSRLHRANLSEWRWKLRLRSTSDPQGYDASRKRRATKCALEWSCTTVRKHSHWGQTSWPRRCLLYGGGDSADAYR